MFIETFALLTQDYFFFVSKILDNLVNRYIYIDRRKNSVPFEHFNLKIASFQYSLRAISIKCTLSLHPVAEYINWKFSQQDDVILEKKETLQA